MRLDGRSFNDYRPIGVEFDNINNSYGSCQLTLVLLLNFGFKLGLIRVYFFLNLKGETKVVATIKAEIGTPDAFKPNCGKLDFFVDWYF